MTWAMQKPELSLCAKEKLARAMETWFGRPVTAYLTDAYFVAGCCIGVVHHHAQTDVYGRFQDGHRVRTSDIVEAHAHGEFWSLRSFTGSHYVVVTFHTEGGQQSLDVLLEQRNKGMHTTPPGVQ